MTVALSRPVDGVVQIALSSWRGRAAGYDVRAFVLGGVLVDTGFPAARSEFMAAVGSLAPSGAVVTHWHEDHSGNVPALAAAGMPLLMHERCEATLRARPPIRAYRRLVWGQTPRLDETLTPFNPSPLQVLDTPGHSDDHIAVWDPERRILASGDLFLGVKVRVAHAHESPGVLLRSLRSVALLQPLILLDAHRGVVPNAAAMLRAKVAWLDETIEEILSLDRAGVDAAHIQKRVLGREPLVGWVSVGEYSKASFVAAVLRDAGAMRRSPSRTPP